MSLPFFDALHTCLPQSGVDILAKESIQEVFRWHPAVHAIHPFAKARTNGLWGLFRYGQMLQEQHGPYDVFITLPPSFSAALIGYGVGSPVRAGFTAAGRGWLLMQRFPKRRGIHLVYAYHELLRDLQTALGNLGQCRVPPIESVTRITFPFSEQERQTTFLSKHDQRRYVVFNVNAEAQSRRLPLATWVALGQKLLQRPEANITIVFIGAAAERARVAEVRQALVPQAQVLDFAGKTSVRELALLLRDADVVVTNDSGPMHLANAVGAPLVTWIGAADPVETKPFNPGRTSAIDKHVPCSPCIKNVCRFPTVRCLETITADEIYQRVKALLDGSKSCLPA